MWQGKKGINRIAHWNFDTFDRRGAEWQLVKQPFDSLISDEPLWHQQQEDPSKRVAVKVLKRFLKIPCVTQNQKDIDRSA